jgi:hypothetical protein
VLKNEESKELIESSIDEEEAEETESQPAT